jgi:hypothetical protein
VLFVVTAYVALNSTQSPLFRVAAGLFSAAALLGVLRFSGVYAEEAPHRLISMIAGVAAFPAMAISVWFTQWRVIREWRASVFMISVLAILGALIVMSTGSRLYLDACAVLSVSGIAYACWSQSFRLGVISAVIMLVGLLCFAAKISPVTALQPADILHLALAAGWLGLSRRLVKD